MAYIKQNWTTGDKITAEKLNHMEGGIEEASGYSVENSPTIVFNSNIEYDTVEEDFYEGDSVISTPFQFQEDSTFNITFNGVEYKNCPTKIYPSLDYVVTGAIVSVVPPEFDWSEYPFGIVFFLENDFVMGMAIICQQIPANKNLKIEYMMKSITISDDFKDAVNLSADLPTPDMFENNPESENFIKNKPFEISNNNESYVLLNGSVHDDATYSITYGGEITYFYPGFTFEVIFDGVTYNNVDYINGIIGDSNFEKYPFYFIYDMDADGLVSNSGAVIESHFQDNLQHEVTITLIMPFVEEPIPGALLTTLPIKIYVGDSPLRLYCNGYHLYSFLAGGGKAIIFRNGISSYGEILAWSYSSIDAYIPERREIVTFYFNSENTTPTEEFQET